MPDKSHKKRTSSLGEDSPAPVAGNSESKDSLMRKSMSESLSFADSSFSAAELPSAKYF